MNQLLGLFANPQSTSPLSAESLSAELVALLDQIEQGVAILSVDGQQVFLANASFRSLWQFSDTPAIGDSNATWLSHIEDQLLSRHLPMLAAPQTARLPRQDGRLYQLESRPFSDNATIWLVSDVTSHADAPQSGGDWELRDMVTGLPNQALLLERIGHAQSSCVRTARKAALLAIAINFGDDPLADTALVQAELLRVAASRLRSCIRRTDTAARTGEREFVVLLESLDNQSVNAALQATNIGEKILTALARPVILNQISTSMTVQIGISLLSGNDSADVQLLQTIALLSTTATPGIRFADAELQQSTQARRALMANVRDALGNHEFKLWYQPVLDSSFSPVGVESLLRWQHPERGLIPPAEFLTSAEDCGLMAAISQWVLFMACARIGEWAGNPALARLEVAVNIGHQEFYAPDFESGLLELLAQTGANPQRLVLEVAEATVLLAPEQARQIMVTLHAQGVRFVIDQFGAGFSHLGLLKDLPVSAIKLDRSLVRNLETNQADATMVSAIIAFASALDLPVVGVGVETQAQLQALAFVDCARFQGNLFCQAQSAELIGTYLLGV